MKHFFQVAAIGCSLPLIEAGSFKWNSAHARDIGEYIPAYETGIGRKIQTLALGPEPTSPAQLIKGRAGPFAERRDTDGQPASVCGYIEGSSEYPYACAVTASCLFTTISGTWVGGCCPPTSVDCNIATTCIDSSVWASLTSIGDHTYSCTFSDYPYCITMTYGDLVGYTIMNCAAEPMTTFELIDYEPVTATRSSSMGTITSIVTSADNDDDTQTSSPTKTSSTSSGPATSTPAPAAKASLPIGAIAGGAVGGIAVIAILILGLVFILRRNKNRNHNGVQHHGLQPGPPPTTEGPPPGGYPSQPAMDQQWQQPPPAFQPGFGAVENNRASVQKPAYDVKATSVYDSALSSPGSPPPQHQSPSPGYQSSPVSPPLPQGQGVSPTEPVFQGSGTGPNQGFQQHQQPGTVFFHEMPAVRADGELRELA